MKTTLWTRWILLADLCWIVLGFVGTLVLRYGVRWSAEERASIHALLPFAVAVAVLWLVLSLCTNLDGFRGGWHFPAVASRILLTIAAVMGTVLAGGYILHNFVSRLALVYFALLLFIGLVLIRWGLRSWLGSCYRKGNFIPVVVVGAGQLAQEAALKIRRHPELRCKVIGFLCPEGDDAASLVGTDTTSVNLSSFGVVELLRAHGVGRVVIALSRPAWQDVLGLMRKCRDYGIEVSLIPQPYELYLSKPDFLDLDGLPMLQLAEHTPSVLSQHCKRALDVSLGVILGLAASPLILGAALILKYIRGRGLVSELRCGQYGKTFRMLRLNVGRRTYHASTFEDVVNRLSISELPQLWNVIRGEMSLVGPRPETIDRVKQYSDWQQKRLSVKPGMTGLAQVHGLREQNSSEEKARFDLQYRLNPSMFTDLSLLLQTTSTLAMRLIRYKRPWHSQSATLVRDLQPSGELTEAFSSAHRAQSSAD